MLVQDTCIVGVTIYRYKDLVREEP